MNKNLTLYFNIYKWTRYTTKLYTHVTFYRVSSINCIWNEVFEQ